MCVCLFIYRPKYVRHEGYSWGCSMETSLQILNPGFGVCRGCRLRVASLVVCM